jgi:hypothetical protein
MRHGLLALLALLGSTTHLAAQGPRLVVTPRIGSVSPTTLFEHIRSQPSVEGEVTSTERLQVGRTTTLGGQVSLRLLGPWRVYGEVGYGGSSYTHLNRSEWGTLISEETAGGSTATTTFALGVGRQLRLGAGAPFLDLTVGGALQRLHVGDLPSTCPDLPPSSGFVPSCRARRWERRYNVPGVVSGLTVGQHLTRHVGIQVGATYALGRANTENFWAPLRPEFQYLEAPKSYTVRTTQLSAGVALSL